MRVDGAAYTVVGAGRSGRAAAQLLAARGATVTLVDDADMERPEGLDARVTFRARTHAVAPGDVAVLSPGISEVSPIRGELAAVAAEVIGELELFYRLCPAPILAITGTDGKSTTTTMLGAICAEAGLDTCVGGNLGNPLCGELETVSPEGVVVAEVSAFQLTTCDQFRPRVAVVTNIAEDHTDYHGGFAPYQAAKRAVWRRMGDGDTLIVNRDDAHIAGWRLPDGPSVLGFGLRPGADRDAWFEEDRLMVRVDGAPACLMTRDALPLLGAHSVANALAATLAASTFGLPLDAARAALMAYTPLPHRLAPVPSSDGVRWVNDSKATNANAASAGLRSIDGPIIALVGGSSKEADFSSFGALLRARAGTVITFGATGDVLADAVGRPEGVHRVATLEEAVQLARERATPGDTVLLSPACASFDQFRSYAHRGEVFEALVRGDSPPR